MLKTRYLRMRLKRLWRRRSPPVCTPETCLYKHRIRTTVFVIEDEAILTHTGDNTLRMKNVTNASTRFDEASADVHTDASHVLTLASDSKASDRVGERHDQACNIYERLSQWDYLLAYLHERSTSPLSIDSSVIICGMIHHVHRLC
jgi:hypothetical protein